MRRLWLRHILLESQCRCHKRKRTEALGPWQKMSRNETTPQEDKQKLQRKRAQDTKTLRYEITNWVLIKIRYLGQLQSPINREPTMSWLQDLFHRAPTFAFISFLEMEAIAHNQINVTTVRFELYISLHV